MRTAALWRGRVTDHTRADGARESLISNGLHVVVCLNCRQDGVRTAVTRFAIHAAMSNRITVTRVGILRKVSPVTSTAARQVDPGVPRRIGNINHITVTMGAS